MPDIQSATTLATLNECHPSIHFTMEIADSNKLPFLGMMIEKKGCKLVTSPDRLVDATVISFLNSVFVEKDQVQKNDALSEGNIVRVILPFKDQRSADSIRKQLKDLGNNIGNPTQMVFTSPKIGEQLQIQERKPPVISWQCVVYQFKCDLCDTDYIGYTTRHLHQRIGHLH